MGQGRQKLFFLRRGVGGGEVVVDAQPRFVVPVLNAHIVHQRPQVTGQAGGEKLRQFLCVEDFDFKMQRPP